MLVRFTRDHIEGLKEGEEKHLPEWLAKKMIEQGSAQLVEIEKVAEVKIRKNKKDEKNIS